MTADSPYRVPGVERTVEIPAGTNLLVVASEPVGREWVLDGLATGVHEDEHVLLITADDPAGSVVTDLRQRAGQEADSVTDHLQVIDCQTDEFDTEATSQDVNTPRNLTDIGISFKDALDEFEAADAERIRFGLLSLSILLSYIDQETCYRFCQTLTRALEQEGAVGQFLLNANAHDDETVRTLQRAFDGTVEIERRDDGHEIRITGIDGVSEEWVQLDSS